MGGPSIDLNLNYRWFWIWQYSRYSVLSQNSIYVMNRLTIEQCFFLKFIFIWVGTLISKIAIFGAQKIRTWANKSQCTHYEWPFLMACRANTSLCHISLKIRTSQLLRSMETAALHSINENDVLISQLMMMQLGIHLMTQSIYCLKRLMAI